MGTSRNTGSDKQTYYKLSLASSQPDSVYDMAQTLFEGGSMRAAYTCAVAAELLEQGVYFDNVYGVSAGSSNTVNYVSRDIDRAMKERYR